MSSTISTTGFDCKDNECANCSTKLLGSHCYACGQPVKGMVRHFSSVIGDFLDTLLAFDSRTWKTLPALFFRPGFLTAEYFSGRRVRYVSPVRLFIFLCITSLFIARLSDDWSITFSNNDIPKEASLSGSSEVDQAVEGDQLVEIKNLSHGGLLVELKESEKVLVEARREVINEVNKGHDKRYIDPQNNPGFTGQPSVNNNFSDPESKLIRMDLDGLPKPMKDWIDDKIESANLNIKEVAKNPSRLKKAFLNTIPYAMVIMLPIFSIILWLLYICKRRLYMEHLIVALHSHAFIFLSILIANVLYLVNSNLLVFPVIASIYKYLMVGLTIWVLIYLFLMQKRIYRQSWFMTLCKYSFVGLAYLCLLSMGVAFTIVWSLAEL
ncbi:DUF3667 domain-containing protein [Microbulbifer variabilis]|uniref:DUF3667 domain-containing protein n=1 Tax=Microbulbifer variabilis TaxID=266805 RepID=UPI001CFCFB22|nr:DUF3667 domain-containing protein [Microbulbifer variabilis]